MADVILDRIDLNNWTFKRSTKRGLKAVAGALTFDNPSQYAYSMSKRMFEQRTLKFNTGMVQDIKNWCEEKSISLQINDTIVLPISGVEIDTRCTGRYSYQSDAVKTFLNQRIGIIKIPTRGGKTYVAAEIIRQYQKRYDGKILFLTDSITLLNQAIKDFKEWFEPHGGVTVGMIQGDNVDIGGVTVGMIQTIAACLKKGRRMTPKKKQLMELLREVKFLIVDEVHDNCSDAKLKLYKKFRNLTHCLSLSATPYRKEAFLQNLKLQAWSGGVIYEVSEETLKAAGVISDYGVFMLYANWENANVTDRDDYHAILRKIIHENRVRNNIIVAAVNICRSLNLKVLLLFTNVEHGKKIAKRLFCDFISGEDSGERREQVKSEFLGAKGSSIMCASTIFKKGVTLPESQVLFNCDGGLEDANTIQKKGRVIGVKEGKDKSLIIDFFDDYDLYFRKHSEARTSTYEEAVGEDGMSIFNVGEIEWKQEFENEVKNWFYAD
jgi:superfamily II DNA or RNA helicase